jgi:hypothetical protein
MTRLASYESDATGRAQRCVWRAFNPKHALKERGGLVLVCRRGKTHRGNQPGHCL